MGSNSNKRNRSNVSKTSGKKTREEKSVENVEKPKLGKKIWSSDDLAETMKPTCEELDYRSSKSTELNPVEKYSKLFKCTKCQKNLKQFIVQNKKAPLHPCLGVLMCKECCAYYEDGEFSLDSDGEDKYCRWCGEGGTLFSCSNCICGFCANCIKLHFSTKFFKEVQNDENWLCFFCNPKPLWDQRYICSLAVQMSEEAPAVSSPKSKTNTQETEDSTEKKSVNKETPVSSQRRKTRTKERRRVCNSGGSPRPKRKRMLTVLSSSDETDCEVPNSPQKKFNLISTPLRTLINETESNSLKDFKSEVLPELEKLLKLSEHQMSFGVEWCRKTIKKLANPDYEKTQEGLVAECKKIKWFLSVLSTYLVQFCNSVESIEKGLCEDEGQKVAFDFTENNATPYTVILEFLSFINSQVKTFLQKGANFSHNSDATPHDDESVVENKENDSSENKSVDYDPAKVCVTNDDTEGNECKEDCYDSSRGEESFGCETDENFDNSLIQSQDFSPDSTLGKTDDFRIAESTQDMQKIMSILENA